MSVSQDRGIRLWERNTEDMVFLEEEKERELEAIVDKTLTSKQQASGNQEDVLTNDGNYSSVFL